MAKIKMQNVRLSFPSLFKFAAFGGESTEKYEATFILDKDEHAAPIKELEKEIQALFKEKNKGKKLGADRVCLKEGDESDWCDVENSMVIKASTKRRPLVIDRDKSPITAEDEIVYAGCYVNAIVSLWFQDNSYGKRVNAQLDGIQFRKDGEPFGESQIDEDEFDAFGDDDDDAGF